MMFLLQSVSSVRMVRNSCVGSWNHIYANGINTPMQVFEFNCEADMVRRPHGSTYGASVEFI